MWYLSIFNSKKDATYEEIMRERKEWVEGGKDKLFHARCKTIRRYEVLGHFPLKIIFIIETDDPQVLNMLANHFGDAWRVETYPMVEREIYETLKEDNTIIGG
jgi:hypothetical protein